MVTEEVIQSVADKLFTGDSANVFAVLDGAAIPNLLDELYQLQSEFVCLYRGELEPDIAHVAPYLVQLDDESDFTEWLLEEGWGKHWGIFAQSDADLRTMRRHLRSLLTVYDAEGKPMLFRYYDPRVLRSYLPTCDAGELQTVFGPVDSYWIEDKDPSAMLCFDIESDCLRAKRLPVG
ncbi:MAG: DUF4123 domain-containing protein [Pyrinomonadaceae bacterium]